jgi:F0F1-type ATP synthase assembly protein I
MSTVEVAMPKDSMSSSEEGNLKNAMMAVSDGVIGAACLVFGGVMLGNWMDVQFHSSPLWVILCSLLGGGLGLARLVQKAISIGQDSEKPKSPSDSTSSAPPEENS